MIVVAWIIMGAVAVILVLSFAHGIYGMIRYFFSSKPYCPECFGDGFRLGRDYDTRPCERCNGSGFLSEEETV